MDLTGAARIVLRDWSVGKLAHFTLPSAKSLSAPAIPSTSEQDPIFAQLYENDEAHLAGIPTRKEKRKAGGLVKLTASRSADERPAAVEQEWAGLQNAADPASDDDDEQPEDDDVEGMDVDSEEEEDEEESEGKENDSGEEEAESDEEQEAPPPPISNKQKRKRVVEPERPSKKVAFASAKSAKSKNAPIKPAQLKKPLKPIDLSSKKSSIKTQDKHTSAPVKAAAKPTKTVPQKAASGGLVEIASKTKKCQQATCKG